MISASTTVAVIGSGCSGLWFLREASELGLDCMLIGEDPHAQFASTRNQGWLQSGALYAGLGQTQAARDCSHGYHDLALYAPDAIHQNIPGYFLFEKEFERNSYAERSRALGIPVTCADASDVESSVAEVRGTPLRYLLRVPDCPVNTQYVLARIADDARLMGAKFHSISPENLALSRTNNEWQISDSTGGIIGSFDYVVLACGALVLAILTKMGSPTATNFEVSKIEVLAVQTQASEAMLCAPFLDRGPMVVPFRFGSSSGFTVCLRTDDENPISWNDHSARPGRADFALSRLEIYLPSLARSIPTAMAQQHVCQKLYTLAGGKQGRSRSRSRIVEDLGIRDPNLEKIFVLYPGKFTTSRIAARDCLGQIARKEGIGVSLQAYGNSSFKNHIKKSTQGLTFN